MEERRTAAWVLGVLALVIIFFTIILPEIRLRGTHTISFKNCKVNFQYWDKGLITDIYRTSQNKLGLCLCTIYQEMPNKVVGNHIIQIYQKYGNHYAQDSLNINSNLDSIIKYKNTLLDTLVLVE